MLSEATWIHRAAAVFQGADTPLYIVGGAVRNPLMGLPISDVDVCGPARPEAVLAMCESTEVRAHLRAAHFGTVELHLTDPDGTRHMAEYTTFREDSYRCGHKPDQVRFTTDIAVDALRRDFSVNALYRQVSPDGLGPVIDPTGGLEHLRRGVLHTVTADPDQVLKDDGLRILRAARFQAELDLEPTEALLESLTRYAPLLRDITRERLREELQKTLLADWRYLQLKRRRPGTESGLRTILHIGAWPELLGSLPCREENLSALKNQARMETLPPVSQRLALLLAGADRAETAARLEDLRFSRREVEAALRLIDAFLQDEPTSVQLARAGLEVLEGVCQMRSALGQQERADGLAGRIRSLRESGAPLSLKALAISGDDLLPLFRTAGVPLSRMGGVLNALWERAVSGRVPNRREELLGAAEQMLAALPENEVSLCGKRTF